MVKKNGNFSVVTGDKPNDIVTVRVIYPTSVPPLVFEGGCDLHTFESVLEAIEEIGYIDLVNGDARKFRAYKADGIVIMHMGTDPRSPRLILPS